MMMACVIRNRMKIGNRTITDSLMPRRFSTISTIIAATSQYSLSWPSVHSLPKQAEQRVAGGGNRDSNRQHIVDQQAQPETTPTGRPRSLEATR